MSHNAAVIAVEKVRQLGISDAQFAQLLGVGKATLSRWINGTNPTTEQAMMLHAAVVDIEELYKRLHPIRPDLSSPDNARTVLKMFREKKLWIGVHALDYDQAFHMTRDEIEKAKTHFEAGVKALAEAGGNARSD